MACSVIDVTIIASLSGFYIVMTLLPVAVVVGVLLATAAFAFVLDLVKVTLFTRLKMVCHKNNPGRRRAAILRRNGPDRIDAALMWFAGNA